jgi:hypothetical protein
METDAQPGLENLPASHTLFFAWCCKYCTISLSLRPQNIERLSRTSSVDVDAIADYGHSSPVGPVLLEPESNLFAFLCQ